MFGYTPDTKKPKIVSPANQDPLLFDDPVISVDV